VDITITLSRKGLALSEISERRGFDVIFTEDSAKKNYLSHAMKTGTEDEDLLWKVDTASRMPTYLVLCQLEYRDLLQQLDKYLPAEEAWIRRAFARFFFQIMCTFLATLLFGHALTGVGRKAIYVVAWKYWHFFLLCFGYWTDEVVQMYGIDSLMRQLSLVWSHPSVYRNLQEQENGLELGRGSISLSLGYDVDKAVDKKKDIPDLLNEKNRTKNNGNAQDRDTITSTGNPLVLSVVADEDEDVDLKYQDKDQDQDKLQKMLVEQMNKDHSDEAERKKAVEYEAIQLIELKDYLKYDYSSCLYAICATRAAMLQIFPFGAVLSVFATVMSRTPLFVYSEELCKSLPPLFLQAPFVHMRERLEQRWKVLDNIRLTKLSSALDTARFEKSDAKSEFPLYEAAQQEKRDKEYARVSKELEDTMLCPPLRVQEWEVAVAGLYEYFYQSRGVNFALNLFRFVVEAGIILLHEEHLKWLLVTAEVVLFLHAAILSLDGVLILGQSMQVRHHAITLSHSFTDSPCYAILYSALTQC